MKNTKLYKLNSKLFIIIAILFCFNFIYVLSPENIVDRIQISLITFAPVFLGLVLFSISKIYKHVLISLPVILFISMVNVSTLMLYFLFAVNTKLFTTVEGWMSSSLYLLLLPIYVGILSVVVFLITLLVVLIMRFFNKR